MSDEKTIKCWSRTGDEIRSIQLPARTSYWIQTIEYIRSWNIYVASALDGTLRFYDENMLELASIFTHRATILCLAFDERRERIITGGIDGCGAWTLRGRVSDRYRSLYRHRSSRIGGLVGSIRYKISFYLECLPHDITCNRDQM
jgi:hypothetical protein